VKLFLSQKKKILPSHFDVSPLPHTHTHSHAPYIYPVYTHTHSHTHTIFTHTHTHTTFTHTHTHIIFTHTHTHTRIHSHIYREVIVLVDYHSVTVATGVLAFFLVNVMYFLLCYVLQKVTLHSTGASVLL